jgi:hypothetical protein
MSLALGEELGFLDRGLGTDGETVVHMESPLGRPPLGKARASRRTALGGLKRGVGAQIAAVMTHTGAKMAE